MWFLVISSYKNAFRYRSIISILFSHKICKVKDVFFRIILIIIILIIIILIIIILIIIIMISKLIRHRYLYKCIQMLH